MRFTTKWRMALIIGVAATAIPIAAHVSPTRSNSVETTPVNLSEHTAVYKENVKTAPTNKSKVAIGHGVRLPQDYYDRRREYWEDRMERRADYLEEEDGSDDDAADSEDSKDTKDSAAGEDDEGDSMDQEEEMIERRREYWQQRLDRDWD